MDVRARIVEVTARGPRPVTPTNAILSATAFREECTFNGVDSPVAGGESNLATVTVADLAQSNESLPTLTISHSIDGMLQVPISYALHHAYYLI